MINLGPYSGKNCPNVRFQPTVIDRILEGTACLSCSLRGLAFTGCIPKEKVPCCPPSGWWVAVPFSVSFWWGIGVSSRPFHQFPIRVTERNAAVQYLFAIRLTRVMNIILLLVLLGSVWGLYYAFGKLLLLVSFVLLGVAFIGYYILAFKYK